MNEGKCAAVQYEPKVKQFSMKKNITVQHGQMKCTTVQYVRRKWSAAQYGLQKFPAAQYERSKCTAAQYIFRECMAVQYRFGRGCDVAAWTQVLRGGPASMLSVRQCSVRLGPTGMQYVRMWTMSCTSAAKKIN